MSNLNHGYFLGGKNHLQKQEVLESLARKVNIADYLDEIAYDRNILIGTSMITDESLRRDIADWNTSREALDRGSLATELKSDSVNCSDVYVLFQFDCSILFLLVKYINNNQKFIDSGSLHTMPHDQPR